MASRGTVVPLAALVAAFGLAGCERSAEAAGGLASPSARAAVPAPSPQSAEGQLATRPDNDLFALLPTQDDFPPDAFLSPSPADASGTGKRKLPETDPPGCATGNPAGFVANVVAAALPSDESDRRTVVVAIGKQTAAQGHAGQIEDWLAKCGRYRTPPSFGGVEGEETVTLERLKPPALGLDEAVSYEQRTTGNVRITGSDQENEVADRVVSVIGGLRGVFVSVSWRNDDDQELALQLLEQLADRVRSA
ncbi:hypothetical protein [Segniliparus rugosus]|uniref:PknH-like extracellular domain-containing protein n=1 Tax=Segniliparus rugosus (strain ATCC BAA-974 / DSM 45345 / CCUG 50838 / CIP 108380 / JCM 13579 / CDC 945) TaxID=679197 RepID=E5XP65_SEGRC|nr:hypothetical protein [Segniliparus rugosus]EFV13847.2 hypothetical protein HMPREF9336_01286 [Segniliparus rugosus ATCC BAA-974]